MEGPCRWATFRRMWPWWWPRSEAGPYGSAMDNEMPTDNADAKRELANMADGVCFARALAGLAEVKVWKLETLSAAGDDVDELERVDASAELTRSLCNYGKQVERMLDSGNSLAHIAVLTGLKVDELRLAVPYAP